MIERPKPTAEPVTEDEVRFRGWVRWIHLVQRAEIGRWYKVRVNDAREALNGERTLRRDAKVLGYGINISKRDGYFYFRLFRKPDRE